MSVHVLQRDEHIITRSIEGKTTLPSFDDLMKTIVKLSQYIEEENLYTLDSDKITEKLSAVAGSFPVLFYGIPHPILREKLSQEQHSKRLQSVLDHGFCLMWTIHNDGTEIDFKLDILGAHQEELPLTTFSIYVNNLYEVSVYHAIES